MKQLLPSLRGTWNYLAAALLFLATGMDSNLLAQRAHHNERSESLIKHLHNDPDTRHGVTVADKALLEQALANPDFAERLATLRGPVYVMMHGIDFEPIQGITIGGRPVQLLDKGDLLAKNPSSFFILKDLQRTSSAAFVELVLHYDFDGSYNQSVEAEALLERVNGQWKNQELATKTIR